MELLQIFNLFLSIGQFHFALLFSQPEKTSPISLNRYGTYKMQIATVHFVHKSASIYIYGLSSVLICTLTEGKETKNMVTLVNDSQSKTNRSVFDLRE